ncbi:amidase [Bordetella sp. BOR01]|uniref:amidase n=1 Tax=Bordetella sp. BOR01 TaxID=2854779 RepID=UPI001C497A16|nr:amidase [Bordetella sp. BOR01]MBV7484736.1 amidase [Bordetella sp. BOR01]
MHDDAAASAGLPDADLAAVESDIAALQAWMAQGILTSQALVLAYLRRIAAYDRQGPGLNAIAALHPDALAQARMRDDERARGQVRGPLHGIPLLVKDNYDVAGLPTTAGTLALADWRPDRDASAVRRLREAGAIILGKTTLHELACGITNISSLTGQTRNPYAPERVPGGSSGGTAAAVAASFAAAGLGSDTSGSIRVPAAVNNLVGLRLTRGLASRAGIVPLSATQDTAGPLARSVADLALVLDVIVGTDAGDPTTARASRHVPPSYRDALRPGALAGLRIGVVRSLFGTLPDEADVSAVAHAALAAMESLGAHLVDVAIPRLESLLAGSSLTPFEFRQALADYLAAQGHAPVGGLADILAQGLHHEQLDAVLRQRDGLRDPDGSCHQAALRARRGLRRAVLAGMKRHDADMLAYPVLRRRPAMAGQPQAGANSQLAAATGMPALSLPAGFTRDGLPVGLELLGRDYTEQHLLDCAWHWEQAMQPRRAPFTTPPLRQGRSPCPRRGTLRLQTAGQGGARVRYEVDLPGAVLRYDAQAEVAPDDAVVALALHAPAPADAARGPVIAHLLRGAARAQGGLALRGDMVQALQGQGLVVRLYTRRFPLGAAQGTLAL